MVSLVDNFIKFSRLYYIKIAYYKNIRIKILKNNTVVNNYMKIDHCPNRTNNNWDLPLFIGHSNK